MQELIKNSKRITAQYPDGKSLKVKTNPELAKKLDVLYEEFMKLRIRNDELTLIGLVSKLNHEELKVWLGSLEDTDKVFMVVEPEYNPSLFADIDSAINYRDSVLDRSPKSHIIMKSFKDINLHMELEL